MSEYGELKTATLVEEWTILRTKIDAMTQEAETLKKVIEEREELIDTPLAEVIKTFRGSYDWESIARFFKPTKSEIETFTTTAWNKLAEKVAPTKKELNVVKESHYNKGSEFFQLRMKPKEK